uniref:2-(3-amino-3-carboxypropyl)histidine synthase subunit 2 n=1 Tax=Parastrongyloides trichosuri TaxID=131310 RepID=A0A0N4ZS82_PARTI
MVDNRHDSSTLKLFSDDNVIDQKVLLDTESKFLNILKSLSTNDIKNFFEIDKCIKWIVQNNFKRISLQFPDSYLCFASFVVQEIEKEIKDAKLYILADTSYRSCCVDDIAAEHAKCDSLIHFGESCLTLTSCRIPVLYILGNLPICMETILNFLSNNNIEEENIVLLYESSYNKHGMEIFDLLKSTFKDKNIIHCNIPTESCNKLVLGRNVPENLNEDIENAFIFFVGSESSPLLTLWMMTFINISQALVYDPIQNKIEFNNISSSKLLRKRLFLIEKVKDAQTIGLVVGTLGVGGHNDAVKRMRELCKTAGKKLYVFSIGKLNEAKLANFSNEIDVFVLLSCPFGVMLDTHDFYKPLVCLFEAEIGLNGKKSWCAGKGWTAEFITFLNDTIELPTSEIDVSLVTGQIRKTNLNTNLNDKESQEIQLYSANTVLSNRSWKGLDASIHTEEDDFTVKEGIKGIGAQYVSEPFQS